MTTDEQNEYIKNILHEISVYVGACDDWIVIKRELLRILPIEIRTNFSTRDPKTKRQTMNSFEQDLARQWQLLTGVLPNVKQNDILKCHLW